MPDNSTRLVVGTMTGTSIDAIDAAVVRINGRELRMSAELVRYSSRELGDLRSLLRTAANQAPMSARRFAKTAYKFGQFHADVIDALKFDAGLDQFDLICVHGQTVFHRPPYSMQLVNASPIAARLQCPVVTDLRQADLAAGGEGAPITPLADWVLFRSQEKKRAIVNLGGFCNVTLLPAGDDADNLSAIEGFDVCSCNQLLDAISRATTGEPFDKDGGCASSGFVDEPLRELLERFLRWQRDSRKSLGTSDDVRPWVSQHVEFYDAPTLAATAVRSIANVIAEPIASSGAEEVFLAGGGTHNLALVGELMSACSVPVAPLDKLGIPVSAREAVCMAVLGALCADGVPITLQQVTHAKVPPMVAGVWTGSFNNVRAQSPSL